MSYIRVVTALALLKALNEAQGIYNTGNRSYDADAAQGASSVDIDAMPLLVVKDTGTGSTSGDRKGPDDTFKINVPLVPGIVPVKEKKVDQYATNGRMMKDFIEGASDAFIDKFDSKFIEAVQTTSNTSNFQGAVLQEKDLFGMDSALTKRKVPRRRRFSVIDADLEEEFLDLDLVKRAMAFNPNYLENGIMRIKNVTFLVTANAPKVGGKPSICEYFGPGVVFILNQFMDMERVYDPENVQINIDYIARYGTKLLKSDYAEVRVKP